MTLKHIQNSLTYWFGVAFIGIVFGIGLQFVSAAWTEPTVAPPGGNIAGPINIGSIGQWKEAALAINTGWDTNGDGTPDTVATNGLLIPNGFVGIGTIAPSAELEINGKGKSQSTVAGDAGNTLVTKDYVDALGTGGGGYPTEISAISSSKQTMGAAVAFCNAKTDGGNSDWRLPTSEEATTFYAQIFTALGGVPLESVIRTSTYYNDSGWTLVGKYSSILSWAFSTGPGRSSSDRDAGYSIWQGTTSNGGIYTMCVR